MNLHFTFSVREISEVRDADQTIKILMYLAISWEVGLMELKCKYFFVSCQILGGEIVSQ